MEFIPEVVQVIPQSNKTVIVYFLSGHIKLFNAKPLIQSGGVYKILEDDIFFRERCTVLNGTLAWDISGSRDEAKCLDLDPIELFNSSPDIEEPEPLKSIVNTLTWK